LYILAALAVTRCKVALDVELFKSSGVTLADIHVHGGLFLTTDIDSHGVRLGHVRMPYYVLKNMFESTSRIGNILTDGCPNWKVLEKLLWHVPALYMRSFSVLKKTHFKLTELFASSLIGNVESLQIQVCDDVFAHSLTSCS